MQSWMVRGVDVPWYSQVFSSLIGTADRVAAAQGGSGAAGPRRGARNAGFAAARNKPGWRTCLFEYDNEFNKV